MGLTTSITEPICQSSLRGQRSWPWQSHILSLLRRFAPRNDDEGVTLLLAMTVKGFTLLLAMTVKGVTLLLTMTVEGFEIISDS